MENSTSYERSTSLNPAIPIMNAANKYVYGKNAPPSYAKLEDQTPQSSNLFQNIQSAKDGAKNACDTIKRCGTLLCCSVSIIVILVILMAIPIAMITIGTMNLKNCTIQRLIPIWLIVAGGLSILKNLSTLIQRLIALRSNKEKQTSSTAVNVIDSLMAFFLLAWFVVGNYWVYSSHKNVKFDDITSNYYCDMLTYLFSFWVITGVYIIVALSCLLFCCTVCFTIFISPNK